MKTKLPCFVLVSLVAGSMGCSLVVGTDTRTVGPLDGGSDARPLPPCGFGVGGSCLGAAQACAKRCDDTRKTCTDGCSGGPKGTCEQACTTANGACSDACESTCETCGTNLGCNLATACAGATR